MPLFSFIFGGGGDDSIMTESKGFRIKYSGEALADHSIEINDLAPALLAVNDLIQEANSVASKKAATISIKVKATEPGCFQIWIQTAKMTVDDLEGIFNSPAASSLVALLVILGFLEGPTTVKGVFNLIKRLCGKAPKKITQKNENEMELETESGEIFTVSKLEWELYQNEKIRKAAHGIIKPIEKAGVETVEFIDGEKTPTKITKSEARFYVPPEQQEEPLQESTRETYVNIVHLWFKDGGYKWKFSEGDNEWSAEIKHQEFLEKLLKDEVTLHARDLLKVRVKQMQFRAGSTVKSDYEILEVLDIQHAPRQTPLL